MPMASLEGYYDRAAPSNTSISPMTLPLSLLQGRTYCTYTGTTIKVSVNYIVYRSTEEEWRQKSPGVMGKEDYGAGPI